MAALLKQISMSINYTIDFDIDHDIYEYNTELIGGKMSELCDKLEQEISKFDDVYLVEVDVPFDEGHYSLRYPIASYEGRYEPINVFIDCGMNVSTNAIVKDIENLLNSIAVENTTEDVYDGTGTGTCFDHHDLDYDYVPNCTPTKLSILYDLSIDKQSISEEDTDLLVGTKEFISSNIGAIENKDIDTIKKLLSNLPIHKRAVKNQVIAILKSLEIEL